MNFIAKIATKENLIKFVSTGLLWIAIGSNLAMAGDKATTQSELEELLVGNMLTYNDGSNDKAIYKSDGSYQRIFSGGHTARGKYVVGDGEVCIDLPNISYCERYVLADGNYILIDRKGERRPIEVLFRD